MGVNESGHEDFWGFESRHFEWKSLQDFTGRTGGFDFAGIIHDHGPVWSDAEFFEGCALSSSSKKNFNEK